MGGRFSSNKPIVLSPAANAVLQEHPYVIEGPPSQEQRTYVIQCRGEHKAICEPFDVLNNTNNQMILFIIIAIIIAIMFYYKTKKSE